MKLRCLIVDDEPIARQIVEQYCSHLPEIEVVASCSNALGARRLLDSHHVDLLFIDINMPVLDGLSFIKTLTHPPLVIFTTAYKEFAHEGFELAACDYLLKPFSFERFIIAVDKVKERFSSRSKKTENHSTGNYAYIKSEGRIYKMNFDEIFFAEADGNNVKIITDNGLIRPAITFTALEELLPKPNFIRVHRSFIINKSKIRLIEGNRVYIGASEIPIGTNYREFFLRELGLK